MAIAPAIIQLAGLSNQPAIPLSASAEIADFAAVKLVSKTSNYKIHLLLPLKYSNLKYLRHQT